MNKFEAVLLISPEISNDQLKKELENFNSILNTNNGNIINKENWGLRDLSYKINNFKKAFYNFFQIEISGSKIEIIKNNLSQNDSIIRHLFVKVSKHQELPTKLYDEKK
tara:strand:- start:413 stop:739 length:327 start_codon:yes stop_codon:yes gene_type:complete